MSFIIDTPTNVKRLLPRLKAAGVVAVIRYVMRPPGGAWKRLQPDEAVAIGKAGLQLGLVYEGAGSTAGYFSAARGQADAAYARGRTDVHGQPDGSAVYFAVDYDASSADLTSRIIPYYAAINAAFAGPGPRLRIGCYGSGFVTNALLDRGLIDLRWITCSLGFRGSRAAVNTRKYELWQKRCDTHLAGIDVDLNVANADNWGQFVPFAHVPVS